MGILAAWVPMVPCGPRGATEKVVRLPCSPAPSLFHNLKPPTNPPTSPFSPFPKHSTGNPPGTIYLAQCRSSQPPMTDNNAKRAWVSDNDDERRSRGGREHVVATPRHTPTPHEPPHHKRRETEAAGARESGRGTSRRPGRRRCRRCGMGRPSSSPATWVGKPRRPRRCPSSWNG